MKFLYTNNIAPDETTHFATSRLGILLFAYVSSVSELYDMSLVVRKLVFGSFDHFPHKQGCTATEDDLSLEISDLGS